MLVSQGHGKMKISIKLSHFSIGLQDQPLTLSLVENSFTFLEYMNIL